MTTPFSIFPKTNTPAPAVITPKTAAYRSDLTLFFVQAHKEDSPIELPFFQKLDRYFCNLQELPVMIQEAEKAQKTALRDRLLGLLCTAILIGLIVATAMTFPTSLAGVVLFLPTILGGITLTIGAGFLLSHAFFKQHDAKCLQAKIDDPEYQESAQYIKENYLKIKAELEAKRQEYQEENPRVDKAFQQQVVQWFDNWIAILDGYCVPPTTDIQKESVT